MQLFAVSAPVTLTLLFSVLTYLLAPTFPAKLQCFVYLNAVSLLLSLAMFYLDVLSLIVSRLISSGISSKFKHYLRSNLTSFAFQRTVLLK
ncbi:hypothetical protein RIF29_07780 [Crotalaria pallida]|uniref:Uncharacterized protein n=1 Tax=Crotalaria pallida TaxID=3830 RepID=A0AAN9J637_CROPI